MDIGVVNTGANPPFIRKYEWCTYEFYQFLSKESLKTAKFFDVSRRIWEIISTKEIIIPYRTLQ